MPNIFIQQATMEDIAQAIRDVSHVTRTFLPNEMPDAIRGLFTGAYIQFEVDEVGDLYLITDNERLGELFSIVGDSLCYDGDIMVFEYNEDTGNLYYILED